MNKKECEIIQDLLPSYSDGITNEGTKNYVEQHLKNCQECRDVLKNMNKEVKIEENTIQTKELKYLKGFKNRRNLIVIISILLTLCICISMVFIRVPLNPDKFSVEWSYISDNEQNNKEKNINIYLSTEYSNIVVTGETEINNKNKEIVIKVKGGIPNGISGGYYGIKTKFAVNENTEKIYIEGAFGKKKLIWSKDMQVMTEKEWKKWYVEQYVPEKLKEVEGIYYMDKNGQTQWIDTIDWKLVYNEIF